MFTFPLPSLLLPFPQIKIRNFKQEGLVPLTWVNVLGIIKTISLKMAQFIYNSEEMLHVK